MLTPAPPRLAKRPSCHSASRSPSPIGGASPPPSEKLSPPDKAPLPTPRPLAQNPPPPPQRRHLRPRTCALRTPPPSSAKASPRPEESARAERIASPSPEETAATERDDAPSSGDSAPPNTDSRTSDESRSASNEAATHHTTRPPHPWKIVRQRPPQPKRKTAGSEPHPAAQNRLRAMLARLHAAPAHHYARPLPRRPAILLQRKPAGSERTLRQRIHVRLRRHRIRPDWPFVTQRLPVIPQRHVTFAQRRFLTARRSSLVHTPRLPPFPSIPRVRRESIT